MGIAQIALDTLPPSVKWANVEKKVLQTILVSPYTPRQMWEKMFQATFRHCPYGNNSFQQGASLDPDRPPLPYI